MSPIFSCRCAAIWLAFGLLAGTVHSAAAQQAIDLGVGQAGVLHLPRPAKDVVIGNPAIADVSVQNPTTVVVFGRKAGGTTLSVLDSAGHALVEEPVVVGAGGPGSVAVTWAGGKAAKTSGGQVFTFACGGFTCVRMDDVAGEGGAATKPAQ